MTLRGSWLSASYIRESRSLRNDINPRHLRPSNLLLKQYKYCSELIPSSLICRSISILVILSRLSAIYKEGNTDLRQYTDHHYKRNNQHYCYSSKSIYYYYIYCNCFIYQRSIKLNSSPTVPKLRPFFFLSRETHVDDPPHHHNLVPV